ncbi:MAG TPA: RsmG family class I SAM-dependent methyltransferase [Mariprofundaceae bacterium]|nr:RsmG family class I SAM-dependent methyltransferase [Mariprofundaceae bacterium]
MKEGEQSLEAAIKRYCAEVLRFSKALNLTSVKQADQFRARFVDPSLALCDDLPDHGSMLDVGSGMGIPSIPILLAKPGLEGMLVERRKKRAEFLRHLARVLSLRIRVYDADIRDLSPLHADALVARAVSGPETLLQLAAGHMKPGGVAILPVSRAAAPAAVSGWTYLGQHSVRAGDETQLVQRYSYRA